MIKFRIYCSIAFTCMATVLATAQSSYAFSYQQPIKKYAGLPFKLEASVRAEIEEDSASARIWLRIDKNEAVGFFENMSKRPIRNAKWNTYTIEGIVDQNALTVSFGSISDYSGSFYYDDFKLSIKDKNGVWDTIYKNNFEKGFDGWQPGIFKKNEAGKYAKINGINLYYETYGDGKPLVILHGNGGCIADADSHIDFFKEKYKIIAIDSRAHGHSVDDKTALTYELMASDVNELLNQLTIDSAYIWGHSDGAILALILAMDYPQKVKKLIAFAANLTPDTTALEPEIFEDIATKSKASDDLKEKQLNMLMFNHPHIAFNNLNRIKAEVLIMSGDHDLITLSHTLNIYKNIPYSNLCIIPGATHQAAWEKPKLFQDLAIDFFETPFQK